MKPPRTSAFMIDEDIADAERRIIEVAARLVDELGWSSVPGTGFRKAAGARYAGLDVEAELAGAVARYRALMVKRA